MEDVKREDFVVGEIYEIEAGGHVFPLKLEESRALPHSLRATGEGFELTFRGPASPILPQGIYRLTRADDAWELFIVPLGPPKDGQGGTSYEVIFN